MMLMFQGCQTVQNKTNNIVKKEEKYLEKFINKKIDKVIQEFGEPTQCCKHPTLRNPNVR